MADKLFVRNGHVGLVQSIVPQVEVGDGTINGTPLDRHALPEEFQDVLLVASVGALAGGGTVSVTITLEESDASGSGYTQVTDENIIDEASIVFTAGSQVAYRSARLHALKRYVRPVAATDFTGGSDPEIPIEVKLIAINPRWSPAQSN